MCVTWCIVIHIIEWYHDPRWLSPVIVMGGVKLKLYSVFWDCDLLTHCNVDTSPLMIAETFFFPQQAPYFTSFLVEAQNRSWVGICCHCEARSNIDGIWWDISFAFDIELVSARVSVIQAPTVPQVVSLLCFFLYHGWNQRMDLMFLLDFLAQNDVNKWGDHKPYEFLNMLGARNFQRLFLFGAR